MIEHVFLQISYKNKVVRNLHLLRGQSVTIGRAIGDIVFEHDHEMSNSHFRFEVGDSECRVTDLDSTNSTWLNKTKVSSAAVADRDELLAGKTVFTVQIQRSKSTPQVLPANSQTLNDSSVKETFSEEGPQTDFDVPIPQTEEETDSIESNSWANLLKEEPTDEIPLEQSKPQWSGNSAEIPPTPEERTFSTVSKRKENLRTPIQIELSVVGAPNETHSLGADETQQFVIGRDASSDLRINDVKVSSKHSLVEFVNSSFIIRDLNSTNGTTLNGQEIKEARLSDGDQLQIGETSLSVKLTYDSTIQSG